MKQFFPGGIFPVLRCILILSTICLCSCSAAQKKKWIYDPDPHRFDSQIEEFINEAETAVMPLEPILFVGNSNIAYWDLAESFPDLPTINRGISGAHISDIIYFFDDIVKRYDPAVLVFTAGDNDVAHGKYAEMVLSDLDRFVELVKAELPNAKIICLPIKPSPDRWHLWDEMREANQLISEFTLVTPNVIYVDTATAILNNDKKPREELFLYDGLHLNSDGYKVWQSKLRPVLKKMDIGE